MSTRIINTLTSEVIMTISIVKDVTPSYSRSGARVYLMSDGNYHVPYIDSLFKAKDFTTLVDAWAYCEAAYYNYN